jgi:RimJ/RimL family protein N-acetyltransferase
VPPTVAPGTFIAGPQNTIPAGPIVLRPWQPGDVGHVVEAFTDPDVQRWHLRSLDEPEAAELIASWHQGWTAETSAQWAVTDATTGAVLGRVGLPFVSLYDGIAEISYWVLPSSRRRGVAAGAVRALSDWALDGLGLHRLQLMHSVDNLLSCRVALAAGFEVEGLRRSSMRHQDGWHDMHIHARIRSAED